MNEGVRIPVWSAMIALLILGYGGVALVAHVISPRMIFLPDYATRAEPPAALRIRVSDDITVSALYLANPDARFTLWYFHGNGESLVDVAGFLNEMREQGFRVFAVEYPGYGVSSGKPTERSVYATTRAAMNFLRTELSTPAEHVIAYGRSVGSGPAVELAATEPVAGLVLEGAFVSAYRVLTRWPLLPGDKFKNLRKMPRVRAPVLVIHGRRDEVIPFWHGEALYAAAKGVKHHLWVESAGHNDLLSQAGARYWSALNTFTRSLGTGTPDSGRTP